MLYIMVGWLLAALLLGQAFTSPVPFLDPEARPLGVVSELSQHLASRARMPDPPGGDPRLPLPTSQDLEAIRKVAQILIMLGEQVIPTILGDSSPQAPHVSSAIPVEDVPNDPVNDK